MAGGAAGISGTITFKLFSDATSRGRHASVQGEWSSDVSSSYLSPSIHVNAAGTYHWIANYGGDANNSATANVCNGANENVVVNPRSPALSTNAGGPFKIGRASCRERV